MLSNGTSFRGKESKLSSIRTHFFGLYRLAKGEIFLCPSLCVGLALLAASLLPSLASITRQNNVCSAG